MSKRTKELLNVSKKNYKKLDKKMFNFYKESLRDLKKEIKAYVEVYESLSYSQQMSTQRKIALAKKIDSILYKLESEAQMNVSEFLRDEVVDGYLGVMYGLEDKVKMNISFTMINEKYVDALVNKKIVGKTFSQRLYRYRDHLAKNVKSELMNDAIIGKGYAYVAKGITEKTEANYKQALRIARTEGHRIQSSATQKGYEDAEDMGIEMMKMWESSLDGDTRDSHEDADGQTVGIDEMFDLDGIETEGPGLSGEPSEDINCRCTTITIVNGISPKFRRDNETKEVITYKNYHEWKKDKELSI